MSKWNWLGLLISTVFAMVLSVLTTWAFNLNSEWALVTGILYGIISAQLGIALGEIIDIHKSSPRGGGG